MVIKENNSEKIKGGIKFGKCDGCGKEGIISWTSEGEDYIKHLHLNGLF